MILPLLQKRRSIRTFEKRPVEAEKVDILLEALLRSPSSRGRYPWEFIVVDNPELLQKMGRAKTHGSSFLAEAPLAVVVAADPQRCDVWIEDCAIASIVLQLAAESLDLSSCWVQIRLRQHRDGRASEDFLRELLHLPPRLQVLSIIAVGYPAEALAGHPRESLPWAQLHRNNFGKF